MESTLHLLTIIMKGQKLFPLKPKIKITLTLTGAQIDPPGEKCIDFFLFSK